MILFIAAQTIIIVIVRCFTDLKSVIMSTRYRIPVILGLETPQNATVLTAMKMVVWVLWGEIKVDFNDLKHIVHLIGLFYVLGDGTMISLNDHHQVL